MSRSSRQNINKETLDLINILYHVNLKNIKHSTHPKTKKFHILKFSWNILWDTSHVKAQNKPHKTLRLKSHQASVLFMI